jgi:hypothetical protein
VKEIQVPDFSRKPERSWVICDICNEEVFREANGRTFFHSPFCVSSDKMRQDSEKFVRRTV